VRFTYSNVHCPKEISAIQNLLLYLFPGIYFGQDCFRFDLFKHWKLINDFIDFTKCLCKLRFYWLNRSICLTFFLFSISSCWFRLVLSLLSRINLWLLFWFYLCFIANQNIVSNLYLLELSHPFSFKDFKSFKSLCFFIISIKWNNYCLDLFVNTYTT